LFSCDVTSFSSETQNISNQGKQRELFLVDMALYLKVKTTLQKTLFLPTLKRKMDIAAARWQNRQNARC
jgi:hypothetical protein